MQFEARPPAGGEDCDQAVFLYTAQEQRSVVTKKCADAYGPIKKTYNGVIRVRSPDERGMISITAGPCSHIAALISL